MAVTLGTWWSAGTDSAAYFGRVMWDTNRVGAVDATPNQSLAGLLARLYDSTTTPDADVARLRDGAAGARPVPGADRPREGDELAAFTLIGLTANAICPISWTHHLVFIVPRSSSW